MSKENGFYFVLHQDIARKHISNDGVHLSNDGSHMLTDNLVDFIDYFISDSYAFNNIDWNKAVYNESLDPESISSNQEFNLKLNLDLFLDDPLRVKETYSNKPIIGYMNINSIRNKFWALCETSKKEPIDISCLDKSKLDSSLCSVLMLISK